MLDGYHLITLTHRQASLEMIGRTILDQENQAETLQALKSRFHWDELLYLATCNRILFLFYQPGRPAEDIRTTLLQSIRPELGDSELTAIADSMRVLHGADAIRHILEVAASMDSLIIGEREIIRQLREAFDRCRDWNLTGDHLRLLLRFTIETAKEIYSSTGIGEKALSVVALAFRQLMQTGLRPDARILLVGAGQTNTLVSKFLYKYGYRNVKVFNRTLAKAQALAEYLEGQALSLDALPAFSGGFDALIVCTGATQAVVTPDLYRSLLAGDTAAKVVVDLSVPSNVDPLVRRAFPMQFIEIEGLREQALENLTHREQERRKAETVLNARIREYRELWHQRQVERALLPVVDDVRAAKNRAMEEIFSQDLAQLAPEARALVGRMMDYLEKKSVATAMRTMKEIAANAGRNMTNAPAAGQPGPVSERHA